QQLGPLKALPGDLVPGPAAWDQGSPYLEAGSGSSLAVWVDSRTNFGLSPFIGGQTGRDIFAARIAADGSLLDTTPIVIALAYGEQTSPRATWNGQSWLVTWSNQTQTQFFYESQVWGVRVASDGTVLDSQPLQILQPSGNSLVGLDVASNGTDWLVVSQADTGGGIVAVRVAADGTVLDPVPAVLAPGTFFLYFDIKLNASGGNYLLTYDGTQSTQDDWQAQLWSGNLTKVGPLFTVPLGVKITGSPAGYLLARNEANYIAAQRMSSAGVVLDPIPIHVTAGGVKGTSNPSLTFDGIDYWASFKFGSNITGARVNTAGVALDPLGVPLAPAPQFGTYVVSGASAGGVDVFQSIGSGFKDLVNVHVNADLTAGPVIDVGASAPSQEFPDLAAVPGGFAVVWTDYPGVASRIMLQLVDTYGAGTMAAPIHVGDGTVARVAYNGNLLCVTYTDPATNVMARRIQLDGTFVDALPIEVMPGFSADVEALGSDFLIAGTNYSSLGIHFVLPYARRLDGNSGALLDPSPVALGNYYARNPRVIVAGNRWLVTWQRNYSHDDPGSEVRAAFVESNGTVLPDFFLANGGTPNVATSGNNVLFTWRTGTSSSSNPDIKGRRMQLDGTLLDTSAGFSIAVAPNMQLSPRAAWNGTEYQVVWADMRGAVVFFDERTDLFGNRVTEAGLVLDGNGIALVDGELPAKDAALASAPSGGALLAYSQFSDAPGEMSYRMRTGLVGAWGDLGFGLDGSAPLALDAAGALQQPGAVTFHLAGTQPFTPGAFVIGVGSSLQPLFGGILVPKLDLLSFFVTDSTGSASWTAPVGVSLAGLTIYAQAWTVDGAGPQGFAASNALDAAGL
ncbi:MAG: hypothetical protein H8D72_00895, partial [Planctomycetes bacterium]|nr:hypothetical protein [Planctomycetota bacterium]